MNDHACRTLLSGWRQPSLLCAPDAMQGTRSRLLPTTNMALTDYVTHPLTC